MAPRGVSLVSYHVTRCDMFVDTQSVSKSDLASSHRLHIFLSCPSFSLARCLVSLTSGRVDICWQWSVLLRILGAPDSRQSGPPAPWLVWSSWLPGLLFLKHGTMGSSGQRRCLCTPDCSIYTVAPRPELPTLHAPWNKDIS